MVNLYNNMNTLFEMNMFCEEDDFLIQSKFDEFVRDEKDYLSIPLERISDYFADFGLNVLNIEEEEIHPTESGSPQTSTVRISLTNSNINAFTKVQDNLDASEYVESADMDISNQIIMIRFSEEVELT